MKRAAAGLDEILTALSQKLRVMDRLQSLAGRDFKPRRLLGLILNEALRACRCRSGSFLTAVPARNELLFDVVRGPRSARLSGRRIPLGTGIAGWVAQRGEAAEVSRPGRDSRFDPRISAELKVSARGILCAPIWSGDTVSGVLELVQSDPRRPFAAGSLDLLKTLCRQAGYVLRRAAEIAQNRERLTRLHALVQVAKAVNSEKRIGCLLNLIAAAGARLMKAEGCRITLKGRDATSALFTAGKFSGRPASALAVPIRSKRGPLGVLEVFDRAEERPFSFEDLELFSALSDLCSVAYENAMLYEKQRANIRDLERKNREIGEARAKLVASEKLALLGQMSAGFSHEIKNLLTPIRLIVEDPPAPEKIDAAAVAAEYGMILEQVDKAVGMTGGLLAFSRREPAQFAPADLNAVMRKCLELLRYRFKNSTIALETHFPEGLPEILCNPTQIEQVTVNLINNAENAISGAGTIALTTGVRRGKVFFSVEDSGCGIRKKDLARVREPFYTSKGEKQGTGLGLTVCAHIVRQHGGELDIESRWGKGTRVTVSLPPAARPKASTTG